MNKFFLLLVCVALSMLMPAAFAAPPPTINYQGFLTSATGTPASGPVVMTFKLYSAATGGAALYTELQPSVVITNGNFNAVIGTFTPIPLPFDQPYWLAVTINADAEMIPRQPLASSPYAFRASSLENTATIAGSQIAGSITTATIPVANIIGAVAGPPGPQGIQGLTGMTGATGAIGAIGAIGPAGPNNITGNLTMVNSTASAGNIVKGVRRFIHNVGSLNTFIGEDAGNFTMTGSGNTGSGAFALNINTTGSNNTAIGISALDSNTTGGNNIAIGPAAGALLTTGNFNIDIGNPGLSGESGVIRIGRLGDQFLTYIIGIYNAPALVNGAAVFVEPDGRLGTNPSSRRFKDNIADMNAASSALMNLRPVTFHYKSDQNPAGRRLQYGLIAEEVAEVYPGLVIHSADGEIDAVAYQHLTPMLLNEFQKQQRTIAAQAARLEMLERKLLNVEAMLGGR